MQLQVKVMGDNQREWKTAKGSAGITRTLSCVEIGDAATLETSFLVEVTNGDCAPAGELKGKNALILVTEVVPLQFGKVAGFKGSIVPPSKAAPMK